MALSLFMSGSASPTPRGSGSPSEAPPPYEIPKDLMQRFPLKGSSMPTHPADSNGSLANWATLFGIKVGPRKYPFVIHRHVVNKIPLLRERFLDMPNSIEAKTGLMELTEVDTMAFAVAIDFAYTSTFDDKIIKAHYAQDDDDGDTDDGKSEAESDIILVNSRKSKSSTSTLSHRDDDPTTSTTDDKDDTKSEPEDEDSIRPTFDNLLVAVFELAQSLQYEALANAAVDSYIKVLSSDPPSAWALDYLKSKDLENSKLMQLMLRAIAWCIKSEGYEAWEEHSFMVGFVNVDVGNAAMVMKAMADYHDEENPFEGRGGVEGCDYHAHAGGERCVRAGKRERQIISKAVKAVRAKKQKRG